ncbi:MAG: SMP-30/gluconolactonase/LRE family protein [Planctomycetota bacterium]|nr:SMP-30/gluconolactonase/LRE family protein [Planctomycetota bacterium]
MLSETPSHIPVSSLLALLFFFPGFLIAEEPVKGFHPTAQAKFFNRHSKWNAIWEEGEFTEGPTVSPEGFVYFSDIGNRMMKYDPTTQKTSVIRNPSQRTNGLFFHLNGKLYACEGANTGGGRRISVTNKEGKTRTLVSHFQGKKLNSPNDLYVAKSGNVFFTDPRYVGDEPLELDFQGVFRVTPQGKIGIATRELTRPNGILIDATEHHAYVAEHHPTQAKQLVKFEIDSQGKFLNKKILFDFGDSRGIDGMCFGHDQNIYATAGSKENAGIYVFSPSGKQLAFLATPGDPTNCTFAKGKHSNRLYLTSASATRPGKYGLYFLELKPTH